MISLEQLRRIFPQYRNVSDEALLRAYHQALHKDMDYGEFEAKCQRQQELRERKRAGKKQGGKRTSGEEGAAGDGLVKLMDAQGYGLDKTGNFYPYRIDEDGNRALDYARGPVRDEVVEEIRNRGAGADPLGLREDEAARRGWYEMKRENPEWMENYQLARADSQDGKWIWQEAGAGNGESAEALPPEASARHMSADGMPVDMGMGMARTPGYMQGIRGAGGAWDDTITAARTEAAQARRPVVREGPGRQEVQGPVRIEGMDIGGAVRGLERLFSGRVTDPYGAGYSIPPQGIELVKKKFAQGMDWLTRDVAEGQHDPYHDDYSVYGR